jgi:hypothetical protein
MFVDAAVQELLNSIMNWRVGVSVILPSPNSQRKGAV